MKLYFSEYHFYVLREKLPKVFVDIIADWSQNDDEEKIAA